MARRSACRNHLGDDRKFATRARIVAAPAERFHADFDREPQSEGSLSSSPVMFKAFAEAITKAKGGTTVVVVVVNC